jgi:hypothetical protein
MTGLTSGLSMAGIISLALAGCVPEGPVTQAQGGPELVVDECVMDPALGERAEAEFWRNVDPRSIPPTRYKVFRGAGEHAATRIYVSHLYSDCYFGIRRADDGPLVTADRNIEKEIGRFANNKSIQKLFQEFMEDCDRRGLNQGASTGGDVLEIPEEMFVGMEESALPCEVLADSNSINVPTISATTMDVVGILFVGDNFTFWSTK